MIAFLEAIEFAEKFIEGRKLADQYAAAGVPARDAFATLCGVIKTMLPADADTLLNATGTLLTSPSEAASQHQS